MRFRNTVLAAIVLAGLVAFIYYYEYQGEEARADAERAEEDVFVFERDKVSGLEIIKPGGAAVHLVREEGEKGDWHMDAPLQTRADPEKVDALLSSLDFLRIERKIEDPEPLEAYKLQEPQARVTLTVRTKDGGTEKSELLIGDKAHTGGGFFAARPGAKEVLKVSGGVDAVLAADGVSLRDMKIVGIDSWDLKRFRIERRGAAVAFVKQEDDWRLESPISFPADRNEVQEIWSEVGTAEAESIESEAPTPADMSRFGLEAGALTLTAEGKEGTAPVRVVFARGEAAGTVYAQRSGINAVMKVKADMLQKLEEAIGGVDALRDRRVAPIDRFRLTHVAAQTAQRSFSLHKDDSSHWNWGGKDGPAVASEEVNALLDAIEELKASGFEDSPVMDQAEPQLTLTLSEDGGEDHRSVTVRVSAKPPDAEARLRLTSSASTAVYLVPKDVVQKLIEKVGSVKEPASAEAASAGDAP